MWLAQKQKRALGAALSSYDLVFPRFEDGFPAWLMTPIFRTRSERDAAASTQRRLVRHLDLYGDPKKDAIRNHRSRPVLFFRVAMSIFRRGTLQIKSSGRYR